MDINAKEIKSDNPYKVDISVCVMIWIRPDLQKKQYDIICKAKPSQLFIVSDGGRNKLEQQLINGNRALYETIDWNCKVHYLFSNHNIGMYQIWKEKNEYIWKNCEYCIFLEDDQMPTISYFTYCRELLEKYKNIDDVVAVCGFNYQNDSSNIVDSDYFFAHHYAVWSIAYWRRTAELFKKLERQLPTYKNGIDRKRIVENIRRFHYSKDLLTQLDSYIANGEFEGHIPSSEFFLSMAACDKEMKFLIPTKNKISNYGATVDADHSAELKMLPRQIQKLFYSQVYEQETEIIHPMTNKVNDEYDKGFNYALLTGKWYLTLYRRLLRLFRMILFKCIAR